MVIVGCFPFPLSSSSDHISLGVTCFTPWPGGVTPLLDLAMAFSRELCRRGPPCGLSVEAPPGPPPPGPARRHLRVAGPGETLLLVQSLVSRVAAQTGLQIWVVVGLHAPPPPWGEILLRVEPDVHPPPVSAWWGAPPEGRPPAGPRG